jgi:hypothetical protein
MTSRTLIFMSILFIISSLNCMEITQNNYNYPISKELLFCHDIYQKNIFPKDVIKYLLQFSTLLKNKDLKNTIKRDTHDRINDPFFREWCNFNIPLSYYHLLKPEQLLIIKHLLLNNFNGKGPPEHPNMFTKYYTLKSKSDYKTFLTLPIDMRRLLSDKIIDEYAGCKLAPYLKYVPYIVQVQYPLSKATWHKRAKSNHCGYEEKFIVPEDHHSHKK